MFFKFLQRPKAYSPIVVKLSGRLFDVYPRSLLWGAVTAVRFVQL